MLVEKKLPAGTRLDVLDICGKPLGVGALILEYDEDAYDVPEIRLADGSIISGCECWWRK